MEIKPTPPDNRQAGLQFDLTKRLRESIQSRQPITPEAEAAADADSSGAPDADAVKKARDEYRDQRHARVANARQHYTANHAGEFAKGVTAARDEYRAGLEKRKQNVEDARQKAGADRIEISDKTAKLAREVEERAKLDDAGRAERVEEMRKLYLEGRLDIDARIARSADKLLGGE